MRKAVILAAGKGSRLYPITHHIAKPLLPLANRRTLEYAFDRLKEIDLTDICLVVGENESQMKEALGDGSAFGIHLTYVKQTVPKGLADAVKYAEAFVNKEPFALYLGDALYSEGFTAQIEAFKASGAANMNIVAEVEDPRRFGVANLDGDRIVKLVEKPQNPESNWAMAGLYFFGPQIWDVLIDLKPSARGEYEITDAIQALIDKGETVLAGKFNGKWFDTGTRESFLETTAFLTGDNGRLDPTATIKGTVGLRVVVGAGAHVKVTMIRDSVILPGARVDTDGEVVGCVLGGENILSGDVLDQILWDGQPA